MARRDITPDPELELRTTRWVECPHCQHYVKYIWPLVGTEVECPHCRQNFTMPELPPLVRRRFGRHDEFRQQRIGPLLMLFICGALLVESIRSGSLWGLAVSAILVGVFAWLALLFPAKLTAHRRLATHVAQQDAPMWVFLLVLMPTYYFAMGAGVVLGQWIGGWIGLAIGGGLGILVASTIFTSIHNSWLIPWSCRRHLKRCQQRGMSPDGTFSKCPHCGYPPTGEIPEWCPECGASFRPYGNLEETLRQLKIDPARVLERPPEGDEERRQERV